MFVSSVQKNDSVTKVICTHLYFLFQIIFHYRLLQDIEQSSLCYTVGLHCLSVLYTIVCICDSIFRFFKIPYISSIIRYLSLFDLIHSVCQLQVHLCCCKWHYFPLFYCWVILHFLYYCMYYIFIHSSVDGHLDCFMSWLL